MKKLFKGLICAGLCGVLAVGASGCNASEHRDPEKAPLRLAIGAVDQKFNPLFYTSQNDGVIANLTQAAMLTVDVDKNGDPVLAYGEDYPTVTLDYKETYYSSSDIELGSSDGRSGKINGNSNGASYTTYEFLIKNGVKFSDGVDLTVMDVLFNLYVYLDPAYSGSSTIYSTKIEGMQAYRMQDPAADENSSFSMLEYYPEALERVNALKDWSEKNYTLSEQGKKDLEKVKELYLEEITSDWNSIETGWVESYKEYRFTEPWQVFYYIEDFIQNQRDYNENDVEVDAKDSEGKYLTTLDPDKGVEGADIVHEQFIKEFAEATSAEKVKEYMDTHENVTEENAKLALQRDYAIDYVYETNTAQGQISHVLTYCATAATAMDRFMLDAMSNKTEGELQVPNISGITVSKSNEFNGKTYSDDHDILKIKVVGVDPKAKWNFGISVAPMHYYSNEEYTAAAMKDYEDGKVYDGTASHFGVKYKDINWLDENVANGDKNSLPVGAGPYKCCSHRFNSEKVTGSNFFYNYTAYFERNEQFTTFGSGVDNAKIKYVTYRVTRDDKIVSALQTKEIDYGTPTATSDNQNALRKGTLKQVDYLAGGYGYVGINPKYVPDIEVRQAIMHSFDTTWIREYYGDSLVNIIDRPMSTTSWAYPKDAKRYYNRITNPDEIKDLVASSGNWTFSEKDKLFHNNADTNKILKINFTIAGESTDHPAYKMFIAAKTFLEQCGFKITVAPSITALKDLTTGDLQVWAAAWSSSIDPDPYQIYSINSNATSTKNWYKDGIMVSGEYGEFAEEYQTALKLNEKIMEGRQTLTQADRETIYKDCLDLIMDLAVEFPTYQRKDLCVYNSAVIDSKSLYKNASYIMGPIDELWKVAYKK
ncbi:MAG: hypothetical protein K2N17_03090 [Clostridia bacterium]|nr:hypothetical protein [Clostridia bacterium]